MDVSHILQVNVFKSVLQMNAFDGVNVYYKLHPAVHFYLEFIQLHPNSGFDVCTICY